MCIHYYLLIRSPRGFNQTWTAVGPQTEMTRQGRGTLLFFLLVSSSRDDAGVRRGGGGGLVVHIQHDQQKSGFGLWKIRIQ